MDPAKKKKIILLSCIGGGVVVVATLLAIILPIVLRVDYGETYNIAKELKSEINEIYNDYACENVEDYVDSTYKTNKAYEEYVTQCANVGGDASELLEKLGNTAGVRRNKEIKARYDSFKKLYEQVVGSNENKEELLKYYSIWHQWEVAIDDLTSADETDADLAAAANILINSGNETWKTYAEGWLEHRKAIATAYRAYDAANYSGNWTELRDAYQSARNDYDTWRSENKPSIADLGSVTTSDTATLQSEYSKLYEQIVDAYEKNYNSESGDCLELFGEVVCD